MESKELIKKIEEELLPYTIGSKKEFNSKELSDLTASIYELFLYEINDLRVAVANLQPDNVYNKR